MTIGTIRDGVNVVSSYEVLGLRSSAPLDLVVEVYWDSVYRLRKHANDPTSLQELNLAYANITMGIEGSNGGVGSVMKQSGEATDERRPGLLRRIIFRNDDVSRTESPGDSGSSWETLQLARSASPEIVDLAYQYWLHRVRGQLGAESRAAEVQLHNAYDLVTSQLGPEASDVAEEPPDSDDISTPRESSPEKSQPRDTGVEVQPDIPHQPTPDVPSRFASIRSSVVASLARRGRAARRAAWLWLEVWAADPFHEYGRNVEASPHSKPDEREEHSHKAPFVRPQPVGESLPRSPLSPAASERMTSEEQATPRPALVVDGETIAISSRALTIGTDPACDVVAKGSDSEQERVLARIWAEDGRVVLHVIDEEQTVLVNGVVAVWAFLEDGDQLEVSGRIYSFVSSAARESQGVRTE